MMVPRIEMGFYKFRNRSTGILPTLQMGRRHAQSPIIPGLYGNEKLSSLLGSNSQLAEFGRGFGLMGSCAHCMIRLINADFPAKSA
jgi:hypothetical protein